MSDRTRLPDFWNPTKGWTYTRGWIDLVGVGYVRPDPISKPLELDGDPDISDAWDISDLELVSSIWNSIEISDLVGYVQCTRENCEWR
jgi:hypothetical protein